jgi:hypothetical protein
MRFRTVVALLLAASAAAAAAAAAADERPKLNVGVLRRDGVLLPFASFDGRRWSAHWPENDVNVTLPISLADVPKRWFGPPGPDATWTAWFGEDEKRPLTIERPVHVPIFCTGHMGLATDYKGAEFDARAPTVPKDALAITGDTELLPITQVSVHAPDATRLIAAITEKFNEEERTAARAFTSWRHPWSDEEREAFPIELETFYRAPETGEKGPFRVSYIEALRRFPSRPQDRGCGLITYVRGWVVESERKPAIDLAARVTYCDRAEVTFIQPFGRLRLDKDTYWVYQLSSWRDEMYAVSRVAPDSIRTVVAMPGGGCPKERR